MECIPKKDIQRIAYFDAYQSFQRQFPHEDAHETRIRTSQYLRPKFHMDTSTYARENSGLAEYDVPEATFTLTSDGHIYYTQYNQQLLELHERQRRLTPDTYSPREHAISLLIETHFANGASTVITSYGDRDLLILRYNHVTKIGTTSVINTQHAEGGSSPLITAQNRFPSLSRVSPTEDIYLYTDKPLSADSAQKILHSLYPTKQQIKPMAYHDHSSPLMQRFSPGIDMPHHAKHFINTLQDEKPSFQWDTSVPYAPDYISHVTLPFMHIQTNVHDTPSIPVNDIKDSTPTHQEHNEAYIQPQSSSYPITTPSDHYPQPIVPYFLNMYENTSFSLPLPWFWKDLQFPTPPPTEIYDRNIPNSTSTPIISTLSINSIRPSFSLTPATQHNAPPIPDNSTKEQNFQSVSHVHPPITENTPQQPKSDRVAPRCDVLIPSTQILPSHDTHITVTMCPKKHTKSDASPQHNRVPNTWENPISVLHNNTSLQQSVRNKILLISNTYKHLSLQQAEITASTFKTVMMLFNFLKKTIAQKCTAATIRQRYIPMMHADAPKRMQYKIPSLLPSILQRFQNSRPYMFLHG